MLLLSLIVPLPDHGTVRKRTHKNGWYKKKCCKKYRRGKACKRCPLHAYR